MVDEVTLGEPGRQYVLARLGTGRRLSQRLLALRRAGRIWAYLPGDTKVTARRDLESDGPGCGSERLGCLIRTLDEHLAAGPTSCIVAEDFLARPGDPVLEHDEVPHLTFDNEVYPYVVSTRATPKDVRRLLTVARSYRMTLVLTELAGEGGVDDTAIDSLARLAKSVIVDAWHNEGEVFCALA